jgi:hypothetical protein
MAKKPPENPQPPEVSESSDETSAIARANFIARSRTADYASDADLRGRLPDDILNSYECHQWKHAAAILATDFPKELADVVHVLRSVKLRKSFMTDRGGGKSPYAKAVAKAFRVWGWHRTTQAVPKESSYERVEE